MPLWHAVSTTNFGCISASWNHVANVLADSLDTGPWASTNNLMLKNVYSIHATMADWSYRFQCVQPDSVKRIGYGRQRYQAQQR